MPAPDHSSLPWFRTVLAGARAWQEALIFFLGIGGTISIGCAARGFSLVQQTVIWAFLLLAWVVVGRRGWLKLFGPVLFYDLIRTSRRTRYFLIRVAYTSFLLALVVSLYLGWNINPGRRAGGVRATDMAKFAASFFYTFMGVQFIVATLFTPAATAGAIAEEKERGTLEFLLATDLDNREIVLSKLLSRLLNISFLILAGLPILSFLQFLGGVDPGLVLAGFAATGLTAASLAGLSIFYSTVSHRARDAILLTYLTAIAYVVLSGISWRLVKPPLNWGTFPSTPTWTSPVTVQDLVEWFSAGNFIAAFEQLSTWIQRGGRLEAVLPSRLFYYAAFHGLVAIGAPLAAIWQLRAAAVKEAYGKERKPSLWVRLIARPRVSDQPMLWKEIFAEPGLRFHWLARTAVLLLIAASFFSPGLILGGDFFRVLKTMSLPNFAWHQHQLNEWVRDVGVATACLALLGVAVRAAGAISSERDRKTFDELLATPLTSKEILAAKWVSSVLNLRWVWVWVWLGLIWLLGVATGGLEAAMVPLLVTAWLVYATAFAGIGLWCSLVCRSTLRAVVWTLFAVLMVSVGHQLITSLTCGACLNPFSMYPRSLGFAWLAKLQLGLTPPFVLKYFTIYERSMGFYDSWNPFYRGDSSVDLVSFSLVGILIWAAFAAALWPRLNKRFCIITGRTAGISPQWETSRRAASPSAAQAAVSPEEK